jgi:hypothetical protein
LDQFREAWVKPTDFMQLPLEERRQLMSEAADKLIVAGYEPSEWGGDEIWAAAELVGQLDRITAERDDMQAQLAEMRGLLRDVESWTALDGDGISQPLLDRVRRAIGLSPYERGDDHGAE